MLQKWANYFIPTPTLIFSFELEDLRLETWDRLTWQNANERQWAAAATEKWMLILILSLLHHEKNGMVKAQAAFHASTQNYYAALLRLLRRLNVSWRKARKWGNVDDTCSNLHFSANFCEFQLNLVLNILLRSHIESLNIFAIISTFMRILLNMQLLIQNLSNTFAVNLHFY